MHRYSESIRLSEAAYKLDCTRYTESLAKLVIVAVPVMCLLFLDCPITFYLFFVQYVHNITWFPGLPGS